MSERSGSGEPDDEADADSGDGDGGDPEESAYPSLPADRLAADGWRELERRRERAFDARVVTVEAATVVLEDGALRDRLRETADRDGLWRFLVASRLALSPRTRASGPLTRLVADRAHAGFAETLADRGFEGVRRTDASPPAEPGFPADATVAGYDALCRVAGVAVRARGWAAVRPLETTYLLVGGAYPIAVRDADDPAAGEAVADAIEPQRFERELVELAGVIE